MPLIPSTKYYQVKHNTTYPWGIMLLQANTPGVGGSSLTLQELQTWITACRSFLKTNMGSFLLKSGVDDSLLLGDLHIVVSSLHGLTSPTSKFTTQYLLCMQANYNAWIHGESNIYCVAHSYWTLWSGL